MMKFEIENARRRIWISIIAVSIVVLLPVFGILIVEVKNRTIGFTIGFIAMFILSGGLMLHDILKNAYSAKFENDHIIFRSFLRNEKVRISNIISVESDQYSKNYWKIKYQGGKVKMHAIFDGAHRFLSELEKQNKNIRFKKC